MSGTQNDRCVVCGENVLCAFARLGHKRGASGIIPIRMVCATCAEAVTAAWARAEGWAKEQKT